MSRILLANELAENALRLVGSYSINDVGANPTEFDQAIRALDKNVAQLVGTMRTWWLVPASATFTIKPSTEKFSINQIAQTLDYDAQTANFTIGQTLTGGTSSATGLIVNDTDAGATGTLELADITGTFQDDEPITDALTGAAVANGVTARAVGQDDFNFFVDAMLLNSADEVLTELAQISRRDYDEIRDKDFEQQPDRIFIDRTMPSPDIYLWPVVPADNVLKLRLTWQKYATNLVTDEGNVTTGLPEAWQRWAEYQCAFDCASGLVTHLPIQERQFLEGVADKAKAALGAWAEHNKHYPRRTKARRF